MCIRDSTKGLCDYMANYLVNYVGSSAVTDLRNTVFDKVVRQGAQFFEAHSTGKLDVYKRQIHRSAIRCSTNLIGQSCSSFFRSCSAGPAAPLCTARSR